MLSNDEQVQRDILRAFYDDDPELLERAMIEALWTALLEGTIAEHERFSAFLQMHYPAYWDEE